MITNKMVAGVYDLINTAKINKMSDDKEKFKIIRFLRKAKKISEELEELLTSSREKLKGENHMDMVAKATLWQQQEAKGEVTLSLDERREINEYFDTYAKNIENCVNSVGDVEFGTEFDKLSESAFEEFVSSNDWELSDIMAIQEVLCEE